MNKEEVEAYHKKEALELTIILLKNYLSTGIESRKYFLNELD